MKVPPRKLLKHENTISASRPGTPRTRRKVPRRSTPRSSEPSSLSDTTTGSGMVSRDTCTNDPAITTSARTSTERIPSKATSRPLITDVTRNETPDVVPTSPFARSRTASGTRSVTRVGSAMPRRFPEITPSISTTTNTHSSGLAASRHSVSGVARYRPSASA
jgi:hypothetical protein